MGTTTFPAALLGKYALDIGEGNGTLLRKSHGRRNLVGYSPWGCKESNTTERFHFHFSLSCIGEGNGNPLQCSCLENPKEGRAWWAAIYGVTQSRTRMKRLSSNNSSMVYYADHSQCNLQADTHRFLLLLLLIYVQRSLNNDQ